MERLPVVEPIPTFDVLIEKLCAAFSGDVVDVDYVKALMENYKSDPKEWKKFAKSDPHRYTRNLVHEGNGKFNLMILCWGENQGSSIHSHAGSHCFLKVLDGQLSEILYDWPDSDEEQSVQPLPKIHEDAGKESECRPMRKTGQMAFKKNGVTYINDTIGLHRMENPSHSDRAVSLHLYSPPFKQCLCFDERTARKVTSTMTFWSRFGERTPLKIPRPSLTDAMIREQLGEAENN